MSEVVCPLCGREMTAIETYPGRGELYCGHCDLVIGGNEAKTPDELTALLAQRTCYNVGDKRDFCCSECGVRMFIEIDDTYTMIASDERTIIKRPNFCPNCGKRVD